jgi:hypothetical protein
MRSLETNFIITIKYDLSLRKPLKNLILHSETTLESLPSKWSACSYGQVVEEKYEP